MKLRAYGETAAASGERGFALIVILSLAALISAYLIATVLNLTGAGLANAREERSMNALRQAKAALIAYAASEQWQLYKGQTTNQPGGLPCPDTDDDGDSEGLCSNALSRIGRLPWKSIGAEDLRDASGERLWYAVSSNFRRLSGTTVINSDTQGLLTVTGTAPASNVVAIVFAPGTPVLGQDRSGSGHNSAAAYLEGFTAGANDYTFTTNALPTDIFNDRLLAITQAELMAAVEPVVAARMQRDVKPYLDAYRATWGRYPFAAPFSNPGTSDYKGAVGKYAGLLPLTADTSFVTWLSSPPPSVSAVSGSIDSALSSCTVASPSVLQCNVTYAGSPVVRIDARAANVGMTLVRSHLIGDLTSTVTPTSISSANGLLGDGTGMVSINLGLPSSATSATIQIPPPLIPLATEDALRLSTTNSSSNAFWFISNQWYKDVFYAVAPEAAPGGAGDCVSNPPCLTVNNLASPNNDKQAIMLLAGRYLNGTTRPASPTIGDYLEGANVSALTSTSYVFETRVGVPTSANDRVVIVAP